MEPKPGEHLQAGHWALLILAVLLAYAPIVLVNQTFWDEWVLLDLAKAGHLWELFKQAGRREHFPLIGPFANLAMPRAWFVTTLLLSCALAPLLFVIIRQATRWSTTEAFWAALLTALIPLDQARFFLSNVPYAFCQVFFALSLVLLLHDLRTPSMAKRVLIVVLTLMAYSTNSFLVLAWIAPAIIGLHAWRQCQALTRMPQRIVETLRHVAARGELLVLPMFYWLAKKWIEPTYGDYANYNKFGMGIRAAFLQTITNIIDQLKDSSVLLPARSDLIELAFAAAIAIIIFCLAARLLSVPLAADDGQSKSSLAASMFAVFAAFALVICALFPYIIVGQPPRFTGLWETRHQTTLIMVSGFTIMAGLRVVLPRRWLWRVAALICAAFLVIDISFSHRLLVDALETGELADLLEQNPSPAGTMLLVREDDQEYRALGRFFPFYEISFLVNQGQTGIPRLALSNREVMDPATDTYATAPVPAVVDKLISLCKDHRSDPQFGFGGFVSNGQVEAISLVATRKPPGLLAALSQAMHLNGTGGKKTDPMVRIEQTSAPMPISACVSPCCR